MQRPFIGGPGEGLQGLKPFPKFLIVNFDDVFLMFIKVNDNLSYLNYVSNQFNLSD